MLVKIFRLGIPMQELKKFVLLWGKVRVVFCCVFITAGGFPIDGTMFSCLSQDDFFTTTNFSSIIIVLLCFALFAFLHLAGRLDCGEFL